MLSLQILAAATCPTGQTAAPSNISSFMCVWSSERTPSAFDCRLRTDAEARACDGVCAWTVRPHKDGELLIEREGISKLGGAKDLGSWMRAKEGGAAAREKAGRLW